METSNWKNKMMEYGRKRLMNNRITKYGLFMKKYYSNIPLFHNSRVLFGEA
jgi:hypothetical protein